MAALLLHFGAGETINEFGGPRGLTALGIAADQFNIPMIELLLDGGADPDALDEDYKTARERLPPRQQCDPQEWDRAMDWLSRKGT
jgi:ankyrin repeat protein